MKTIIVLIFLPLFCCAQSPAPLPARFQTAIAQGFPVDLRPLVKWWQNPGNAQRPLAAWVRIQGDVIRADVYGWVVNGCVCKSPTQSVAVKVRLVHPPARDRAVHEQLRQIWKEVAKGEGTLKEKIEATIEAFKAQKSQSPELADLMAQNELAKLDLFHSSGLMEQAGQDYAARALQIKLDLLHEKHQIEIRAAIASLQMHEFELAAVERELPLAKEALAATTKSVIAAEMDLRRFTKSGETKEELAARQLAQEAAKASREAEEKLEKAESATAVGPYRVDVFALTTGKTFQGLPVYDAGLSDE